MGLVVVLVELVELVELVDGIDVDVAESTGVVVDSPESSSPEQEDSARATASAGAASRRVTTAKRLRRSPAEGPERTARS